MDGRFSDGVFSSFAFAACEEGEVLTWGAIAWASDFTSRLPRPLSDNGVSFVSCGMDFSLTFPRYDKQLERHE